jgi:hypothetical protein
MKRIFLTALFLVLVSISNVGAEPPRVEKGLHHVRTSIPLVYRRSVGLNSAELDVSYGYLLRDYLEPYVLVGLEWNAGASGFSGSNEESVSGGLRWWFDLGSRLFPYIEADGGVSSRKSRDGLLATTSGVTVITGSRSTSEIFGAGGGAVFLLAKSVGISTAFQYFRTRAGGNTFNVPISLEIFF